MILSYASNPNPDAATVHTCVISKGKGIQRVRPPGP